MSDRDAPIALVRYTVMTWVTMGILRVWLGACMWLWYVRYYRLYFRNLPSFPSNHWFWGTIPTDDVFKYLAKTTLDIIGLAEFDYKFRALSEPHNGLADAYARMFQGSMDINPLNILQAVIGSILMALIAEKKQVTRRIGMKIVQDCKRAILFDHTEGSEKET
nr:hypothetical protein L204_00229 [Cryptococcus depauperatus CBS 7855]